MRPNSVTTGSPQSLRVLQPYRNPGEAACFIEGVRRAADALGHSTEFVSAGSIPIALTLEPHETAPDPPPEPVVTIEIPEEKPVMIEDKLIKRAKIKKRKRAEPDAGA